MYHILNKSAIQNLDKITFFNFSSYFLKIIIKISLIIAQQVAPFLEIHRLRCFFVMYSKLCKESDFRCF